MTQRLSTYPMNGSVKKDQATYISGWGSERVVEGEGRDGETSDVGLSVVKTLYGMSWRNNVDVIQRTVL